MADQDLLREQYELEKALATRLRETPKGDRPALYSDVYEELYRRLPHLSQAESAELTEWRRAQIATELLLLEPFLSADLSVIEFGAGDGGLSARLAERVGRVWAVDASPRWVTGLETIATLDRVVAAGPKLDIAEGSIDLVYSCHFVEHLHPEDLADHLREARRVLKPRGLYVCVTPNRLLGPHDVSRSFDTVASGLHLQEYTHNSLRRVLRSQGFASVEVIRHLGKPPQAFESHVYLFAELLMSAVPRRLRHWILSSTRLFGRRSPFRPFEQVKLVATR